MEMEWIDVNERLPEIPEGQFGVSVIVAVYDSMYAEFSGADGYSVYGAVYHTAERGEPDFEALYIGGKEGAEYGPIIDDVTHWMYYPEPPKRRGL